tara:strand:+ start:772 stop:1146 length:375 start_codon:yes stop_codon:yes gene_type:complete
LKHILRNKVDMEDFNWDLFKSDQSEYDEQLTRSAFENTYLILTGKVTYENLLDKQSMQQGSIDQHMDTAVLFNPFTDGYSAKFPHLHNEVSRIELIDCMIEYYTESEEYEKCAELVKLKIKRYE